MDLPRLLRLLDLIYLGLSCVALFGLRRYMGGVSAAERVYSHLQMPVSLIVPAYNEGATIASSIRALLQLRYQHFEVIVVNDGSKDETLAVLQSEFELHPFPEAYRVQIRTQPVRGIYRSLKHPNLRVIDKENGGKADSINAGVNAARYPLFYAGDADSVLEPNSLARVVRPFLEDPHMVACGGTVRIVNGCTVRGGVIEQVQLPRNPLALVQVVEYLRAFLGGRIGWSAINGMLIVSGAFGVFHRETVVAVDGFRADAIGEDMELIVRLHRKLSEQRRRYRIAFIPDPCAGRRCPKTWHTGPAAPALASRPGREPVEQSGPVLRQAQRHGRLAGIPLLRPVRAPESSRRNWRPAVHGPGLRARNHVRHLLPGIRGRSICARRHALDHGVLLEELSFHTYPKARHLAVLFAVADSNLGYRQITSCGGSRHWSGGWPAARSSGA